MPLPIPSYTVVLGSNYQTLVPLILPQDADAVVRFDFVDAAGAAVDLSGKSLKFTAWASIDNGVTKEILFLRDNDTGSAGIGGVTIVGTSHNGVQVSFTQTNTEFLLNEWSRYDLTSLTDEQVIATGALSIAPATQ